MRRLSMIAVGVAATTACVDPLPTAPLSFAVQGGPPQYEVINLGSLGPPDHPERGNSDAYAVNERGQVVGWSFTGDAVNGTEVAHAFRYDDGVMTDLGTLGVSSFAHYINQPGQVAGKSWTAAGDWHAFFWDAGVMQDIGTLGGTFSEATGLNNAGQVVGRSTTAGGDVHAFLWENGAIRDLGTLGGNTSVARAINETGQIVGESSTAAGDVHAFVWEAGEMRDLGTLGGTFSTAVAISDAGHVTGQSTDSEGGTRAFLWKDGEMQDLGSLPDYPASWGLAVNSAGQVAGQASRDFVRHGFFWWHGVMQDLGTFGGPRTNVAGLNARGQVAGYSQWCGFVSCQHAFVWEDGVMTDLGGLPGHGYYLARALNDRGDVVGVSRTSVGSYESRAVLWRRVQAVAFTVQPSTTLPLFTMQPAVEVTAVDGGGNPAVGFTGLVTIAIERNGGLLLPGTLSGTTTVAAVNGVATFSDLSIDQPGNGYTLRATAPGVADATSEPFDIGVGAVTPLPTSASHAHR